MFSFVVVIVLYYEKQHPMRVSCGNTATPCSTRQGGGSWSGWALRRLRAVCTVLHKLPAKPPFNAQMPMPDLVIEG